MHTLEEVHSGTFPLLFYRLLCVCEHSDILLWSHTVFRLLYSREVFTAKVHVTGDQACVLLRPFGHLL